MWKNAHGDISKNSTCIIFWQAAAASAVWGVSTLSVDRTGDRGPGVSEEGRKSNSPQSSQKSLADSSDTEHST